MKLFDKMRQQKLLSSTLMMFTLAVGILIGTLINTQVNAQRGQTAAPDATPLVVPRASALGNEFSALAKKLEPSVVNIVVEMTAKAPVSGVFGAPGGDDDDDTADLFRRFFGQDPRGGGGRNGAPQGPAPSVKRQASGSGFIVDKNGYIITNNHVVEGADKIRVKLHNDPMEYKARLIGRDAETDLAVIKIDRRQPFVPVTIANSDAIEVGDWAVAIGSPFELEASVTVGIVSAKGRDINPGRQFQHFIQTDAAINPGNSGGPLLNIKGEVIGVNTMIATRTGGSEGIGFAMPMNMAVRVYNDLIKDGRVTRGSIGVSWNNNNSRPETLKALGVDHGVVVDAVQPDGPASAAGLKKDDIIVGLNGQPIKDGDDLVARVADTPVNTPITLNVDRDGKKVDFKVTIKDRTEVFKNDPRILSENDAPATGKPETVRDVKFGIGLRPLTDEERNSVPEKRGMFVTRVEEESFAKEIGMEEGRDIITAINRQPVNSMEDVRKIQQNLKPGDAVAFRVLRSPSRGQGRQAAGQPVSLLLSGYLPQN